MLTARRDYSEKFQIGSLRTMISLVVLLPNPGNGRQSRKDNNIFHSAIKKEDLLLPLTEVM